MLLKLELMPSYKAKDIGIEAFLEENALTKTLKPLLRVALLPLAVQHGWKNYCEQMPTTSRNLEMGIDLFLRAWKHPLRMASVTNTYLTMTNSYSSAQKEIKNKKHYLVYTDLDHKIPFKPEEGNLYVYMLVQMARFGKELVDKYTQYTQNEIKAVLDCFLKVNAAGRDTFCNYPTTMPRFASHNQITLSLVQKLDEPLNCCPSQHIAYSALVYNISKTVLELPTRNEQLWHSILVASKKMIQPVLYTKQHTLVDVAFGLHSARKAFEECFSLPFDDLLPFFPEMQPISPDLPYDEIARIYQRGSELFKPERSLADVVGQYFQERGFPLVEPGENNAYFNLETGGVVKLV